MPFCVNECVKSVKIRLSKKVETRLGSRAVSMDGGCC